MRRLLLAALLFALPATAQAGELWQGARDGDRAEDILARFSDARENPEPSTLANEAKCDIHIPSIEVADRRFKVCFYMLGGVLTQVTLTLQESVRGPQGERIFETLVDALRTRYGRETSIEGEEGILTIRNADWDEGGLGVNLILVYVGQNDVIMNVNYRAGEVDPAPNL